MEKENATDAELGRIVGFSDSIFAFAITLLAMTFNVPKLTPGLSDIELLNQLFSYQMDDYISFFISFVVVGSFWISHHRKFRHLRRYDMTFMWLNLFSLMFIVLMPFPTEFLEDYSSLRPAVIFYALTMAATSLMFAITWVYAASNRRLVRSDLSKRYIRRSIIYDLIIPILFLLSIPLSFIDLDFAKYSWLFILIGPVLFMHLNRKHKEVGG